jgi:hypothetical protein
MPVPDVVQRVRGAYAADDFTVLIETYSRFSGFLSVW